MNHAYILTLSCPDRLGIVHAVSGFLLDNGDKDTESRVLARAVKWHSEHRVLLNGHKTVIFK